MLKDFLTRKVKGTFPTPAPTRGWEVSRTLWTCFFRTLWLILYFANRLLHVKKGLLDNLKNFYFFQMQSGGIALPADVEHRCHEFLRIAEVCLLERVSAGWRIRIRRALHTMPWSAVHCDGEDPDVKAWLAGLAKSKVNIRTVELVRPLEDDPVSHHTQSFWRRGTACEKGHTNLHTVEKETNWLTMY